MVLLELMGFPGSLITGDTISKKLPRNRGTSLREGNSTEKSSQGSVHQANSLQRGHPFLPWEHKAWTTPEQQGPGTHSVIRSTGGPAAMRVSDLDSEHVARTTTHVY